MCNHGLQDILRIFRHAYYMHNIAHYILSPRRISSQIVCGIFFHGAHGKGGRKCMDQMRGKTLATFVKHGESFCTWWNEVLYCWPF